MAAFVQAAKFSSLSAQAREQLKIHVFDTAGVAIGALTAPPLIAIHGLLDDLGGSHPAAGLAATLIGGGTATPERAAFYNGALSRYLDFMDAYLAPGETNHPSDNIMPILAAAETADASGQELLTAIAVAYQVITRLADEAPVRSEGFDHTTHGSYAVAAGASRALGLTVGQTANAVAIAGTANNALRVTRTGNLSNWKGLAYPQTAKEGVFAALLASRGITGPAEVFEGNKGFKDAIAGPFIIDWEHENLERVRRTSLKRHDAEIHSQSALDAALELRRAPGFDIHAVTAVRLRTFDVAYSIIGGGEEGDKRTVNTKEEADHSLPWLLAVALLDGRVTSHQYTPERIRAADVQALMHRVDVAPDARLSALFPEWMPADLTVELSDGRTLHAERRDYPGLHTRPFTWDQAREKFDDLASPFAPPELRNRIGEIIANLEHHSARELAAALGEVTAPSGTTASTRPRE